MSCLSPEQLTALLERGGLDSADPGERLHLAECPACREAWSVLAAADAVLGAAGEAEREGSRRILLRRHRAGRRASGGGSRRGGAVAAAVLLGFAVLLALASSGTRKRNGERPAPQARQEAGDLEKTLEEEAGRLEAERNRARLAEIERERRRLVRPDPQPDAERPSEEKRQEMLARLEEERLRLEAQMRQAVERARMEQEERERRAQAQAPREPRKETKAEAAPAGIARVERVEGEVYLAARGERTPAKVGLDILPGQGLETGPKSSAALAYPDKTRLELGGDTAVREILEREAPGRNARGKRLFLAQGTLKADVARQTLEQPMTIATPHAEARVLGTAFRLVVDPGSTRLEVREGRVRLTRVRDGKSVEVGAGSSATSADLASRPIALDEIVLLPPQGRFVGGEWKVVRDAGASNGLAFEAERPAYKIYESVKTVPSHVAFSFVAEENRDYHVWIRGWSLATADRRMHDEVAIEPVNGTLSKKCPHVGDKDNAFIYTGWCLHPGYAWIGGHDEDQAGEVVPVSIRFNRSGLQTLKLYAIQGPIRIDALWISTTQKTRPPGLAPVPGK